MSIALFDPSIATTNLGDEIIIESVRDSLETLFPDEQLLRLPTQECISRISGRMSQASAFRFVGGTNLLASNMLRYRQWQIGLLDIPYLRDIVLMGVGWWQYQDAPDFYTRFILRRILSATHMHSVRDDYTLKKLASIGIANVINTGCPTMWKLTAAHCNQVSAVRAQDVVFTLTDYHTNLAADLLLIAELRANYRRLYFWPQGAGDRRYLQQLAITDVTWIRPTLHAYDELLLTQDVDFIGTRLHGGVRALQRYRRALILAVDNRAIEISANTQLPVVRRDDLAAIKHWIQHPEKLDIKMDNAAIQSWRQQFHPQSVSDNA